MPQSAMEKSEKLRRSRHIRNYGRNALGMCVRKKAFRKCDYTDEGHLNQFVSEDAAADFEEKRYANGQHQDGYSTKVKDIVPSCRSLSPKRALLIRVLFVFLKRAGTATHAG